MTQDIDGIDNINSTMTLRIADDKKGDIYSALILEIYKLGKSISCIIKDKLLIPKVENHNKSIFYTPKITG